MNPDFYITTVLMGYGHLRAADNVAGLGRGRLLRVDQPPFASLADIWVWKSSQDLYHVVSRTVETRLRFLFRVLERIEDIPEDSKQASMEYSMFVRLLVRMGVGRGLERLCEPLDHEPQGEMCLPRLHTFFLPGLACIYNRLPGKNFQLLCDADFHRVWAPIKPNDGDVTYIVPTSAGADRLMSYGVAHGRIVVTGFPLPVANTGGRDLDVLQSDLRARLERLSPRSDSPLRLVFALSGAGCYLILLKALIRELLPALRSGKLTLTIAAGDNHRAKAEIESHLAALNVRVTAPLCERDCATTNATTAGGGCATPKVTAGGGRSTVLAATSLSKGCATTADGITILYSPDVRESFGLFNRAMRESDLLITKPGELVFYAALGVPQVLLPSVGKHEFKNRAYLIENSAALDLPGVESAGAWLLAQRANGAWRRAAESAFDRLPKLGTFAINDIVKP